MNKRVFNFDQFVNESYVPNLLNEEDEDSPWKDLAVMMKDNMPEIEKEVADALAGKEKEFAQKLGTKLEKEIDESIGVFTVLGGVLSLGKAVELVALIPKWIANKLDPKKKTMATQFFNWLDKQGNDYTHFIEHKMILPLLQKTPGFKNWFNEQPKDVQEKWAKWTLTILILGLAGKSGVDAYKAFKEGHDIAATVETALTGVKSTEIAQNVASAVTASTESAIDIASVVADVGDEVVDAVDDFANSTTADDIELDPADLPTKK